MPPLRPIAHEDRLSLVEHLDELRTRPIWCIAVFAVAFGFCYWQNDQVLSIVNRPVEKAFAPGKNPRDQLVQTQVFQQRIGEISRALGPFLVAVHQSSTS